MENAKRDNQDRAVSDVTHAAANTARCKQQRREEDEGRKSIQDLLFYVEPARRGLVEGDMNPNNTSSSTTLITELHYQVT